MTRSFLFSSPTKRLAGTFIFVWPRVSSPHPRTADDAVNVRNSKLVRAIDKKLSVSSFVPSSCVCSETPEEKNEDFAFSSVPEQSFKFPSLQVSAVFWSWPVNSHLSLKEMLMAISSRSPCYSLRPCVHD